MKNDGRRRERVTPTNTCCHPMSAKQPLTVYSDCALRRCGGGEAGSPYVGRLDGETSLEGRSAARLLRSRASSLAMSPTRARGSDAMAPCLDAGASAPKLCFLIRVAWRPCGAAKRSPKRIRMHPRARQATRICGSPGGKRFPDEFESASHCSQNSCFRKISRSGQLPPIELNGHAFDFG